MNRPVTTSRHGLTLVELMLALTITVVIGGGLASMLTMISQVGAYNRDTRTASLRAHAAQIRLQAYTQTGFCILQADADTGEFALWAEDVNASETVNLTEVRVFTFSAEGELRCQRVVFPDTFTPEMIEAADVELPASTDFFKLMRRQEQAGVVQHVAIVDGVSAASIDHDAPTLLDANRLRYRFTQTFTSGTATETLIAMPLSNHRTPEL